jgi:hypothetical protein
VQFLGMTPNIVNIYTLAKKVKDFGYKTWYFDHKEQFQLFFGSKMAL